MYDYYKSLKYYDKLRYMSFHFTKIKNFNQYLKNARDKSHLGSGKLSSTRMMSSLTLVV